VEVQSAPQNLEAEISVLGSILLDNSVMGILGSLRPESFYREGHREIYRAMEKLSLRGEPVDLVTLSEELRRSAKLEAAGGMAYLVGLAEQTPTAAYAEHYAKIVLEKATLRRLITAAGEVARSAYEQAAPVEVILDQAGAKILEIAAREGAEAFAAMRELVHLTFEEIQLRYDHEAPDTGLRTGFRELDEVLGGLEAGTLMIIAARPSMGKTAFALTIAQHVALRQQVPVAIFSLEMPAKQLVTRMLCSEARVDMNRLRQGHITDRDYQRLVEIASRMSEAPIFIDDAASLTVLELRGRARRLMAQQPVGLIIIDYLQLMAGGTNAGGGENRQQEIATISRGLKGLARELGIPVIALSQLSRAVEARPNKRPMLSDLRESGSIEQDADIVTFIYRDDYYNPNTDKAGVAEIIIGKQRNGPTGSVELQFHAAHVRFNDLAKDQI
jgi:replicative DNA helicase